MNISDLLLNRKEIFRRIGYALFLLIGIAASLGIAASGLPEDFRFWLAVVVISACVICLFRWEWLNMTHQYGLTLGPPGDGRMRKLTEKGLGRLLSLIELMSRFAWKPGGILLGRPLPQHQIFGLFHHFWVGPPDDRHMLTIAGSRIGKGTASLIPNLLLYPGSALVIDPKGELAQITAARRGRGSERVTEPLGQDVYIIDPEEIVVGHQRASWNPLGELDPNDRHLYRKTERIAEALVPPPPPGAEKFFYDWARSLLHAVILHVFDNEPPERRNLVYARKLIGQGDRELFAMVVAENQRLGKPPPFASAFEALLHFMASRTTQGGRVAGTASHIIGMADVTRSGVVATLLQETSYLDDPLMEQTLERSDFKLADLKLKPTTIYICLKGTSMAGPIARLMYVLIDLAVTAMEAIPGKPPFNVLFAMDEFYCLGQNEAIDRAMGLVAGFGVTLWPLLQHIGQLKRYYPNTWDNFIRNCRAVQYYGDLDPETLNLLEARIGPVEAKGPNGTIVRRPLLSALELQSSYFNRVDRRQIVLFQQEPAAALQLIDYYLFFPKRSYEDDPRAKDRDLYAAWNAVK